MKYEVVVKVRFVIYADDKEEAVNTARNLIILDYEDVDVEELFYTLDDVKESDYEVLSVKEVA